MNNHIRDEIDTLLGKIDAARSYQETDWKCQEDQRTASEQERPTLHVYILNHPLEELLTEQMSDKVIESDTEPVSDGASITASETSNQFSPVFPHSTRLRTQRYILMLLVAVLILLSAGAGIATTIMLAQAPGASVTLIPAQKEVTATTSIGITLDKPDVTRHEIQGRLLSSLTLSQTRTAPATGTGYQEARAAHGNITFYNAQPSVQIVSSGTLLMGADGVAVVTDQNAVIPPAVFPTDGQATVVAHAVLPGPTGNIRAGDIYGACCRLNVFATNGAFHGGQYAHTFSKVTQQDIATTVSILKSSLTQSIDAAFGAQVSTSETLVSPVPCAPTMTTDYPVGTETTHVSITLNETCTGEVYDTQAFERLVTQSTSQTATEQLGADYSLIGNVQTSILQNSVKDQKQGAITLQVKGTGLWLYQLRQQQLEQFKSMIAGKSDVQAKAILLNATGVCTVSLSIKSGTMVPTDKSRISFVIVQPGEQVMKGITHRAENQERSHYSFTDEHV